MPAECSMQATGYNCSIRLDTGKLVGFDYDKAITKENISAWINDRESLLKDFFNKHYGVTLGILCADPTPESMKYIQAKVKKAQEFNIKTLVKYCTYRDICHENLFKKELNDLTSHCDGVIVQLPIGNLEAITIQRYISQIPYWKDVDGLGSISQVELNNFGITSKGVVPCTAQGIYSYLSEINFFAWQRTMEQTTRTEEQFPYCPTVLFIGASKLVNRPLAQKLIHDKWSVIFANRRTNFEQLHEMACKADLIVTATGSYNLLSKVIANSSAKNMCLVIDAGTRIEDGKLVGDIAEQLKSPESKTRGWYITPVPGGVGRLTVTNIFVNLQHCVITQELLNKGQ